MPALFRRAVLLLLVVVGSLAARAQQSAFSDAAATWSSARHGSFLRALARDRAGNLWVGTEDDGVSVRDAATGVWRTYGADVLGDANGYAVLGDQSGRMWVGTRTHGVAVFNGSRWQTYAPPYGPLGSRFFALAENPATGDIWIGTEAGLTRYAPSTRTWTHRTTFDGLPENGISSLACDSAGTLYVGLQSGGVAVGWSGTGYRQWRSVPGPSVPVAASDAPSGIGLPTRFGHGLPTRLVNCVLAARGGQTLYCGTGYGLARSLDGGRTWMYFAVGTTWGAMRDKFVTCLAEGADGAIWVGHREALPERLDPRTDTFSTPGVVTSSGGGELYAQALLPAQGSVLMASFGGGLQSVLAPGTSVSETGQPFLAGEVPPLPPLPSAPDRAGLLALWRMVSARRAAATTATAPAATPLVVPLEDDWTTRGAWLGRYGTHWAHLYGMLDWDPVLWGIRGTDATTDQRLVRRIRDDDGMFSHIFSDYSDNPDSLEMPPTFLAKRVASGQTNPAKNRREAEINDGGWRDHTARGPVAPVIRVAVPPGLFVLAIPNHNKDGHTKFNRFRDFDLRVWPEGAQLPDKASDAVNGLPAEEMAHARLFDYWGAVWKRFLVRGLGVVQVEFNRNDSFSGQITGILLSRADADFPAPYFGPGVEQDTLSAGADPHTEQELASALLR